MIDRHLMNMLGNLLIVQKSGTLGRGLTCLSKLYFPSRILKKTFTTVAEYDKVSSETLESLHDHFDELLEQHSTITDNELKDGVLTVIFSHQIGNELTYVINKQSMNFQLWLSSPKSGPKRYDYLDEEDAWIYRRTKQSLHEILQREISDILNENVHFFKCQHSGREKV